MPYMICGPLLSRAFPASQAGAASSYCCSVLGTACAAAECLDGRPLLQCGLCCAGKGKSCGSCPAATASTWCAACSAASPSGSILRAGQYAACINLLTMPLPVLHGQPC